RWRRSVSERSVVLFDPGERFAKPGSEFTSDAAQGIQDVIFSSRLRLLLIQDFTGTAVLREQRQHVLASETSDRPFHNRSASGPLADFPSGLRGEAYVRRLPHEEQGVMDALVGNQAEEGRLFKLYGQALAQRPIKYRVAGLVEEIGDDDAVFRGPRRWAMEVEECAREGHSANATCHHEPLHCGPLGWSRFRSVPEPLQVGADICGMLIAQIAVLLERLCEDCIEARV